MKLLAIRNYLKKHSINISTSLGDNEEFDNISTLSNANHNDLTFFHNQKYINFLKSTKAKACLINNKFSSYLCNSCEAIIVDDPYLSYALITNLISPNEISNGNIDNTAIISKNSKILENVQINNNVTIKDNCIINKNVIVHENSVIGPNVNIGENSLIMSNCSINDSIIGNNTTIQSGVVIGGKGFGFTPKQKIEIKHLGNVIIGNNVDIGSNTTVDRGTINSTRIGDNCRIDNLVQIAHNVELGDNSIIASQSGIAGSTKIGKNCLMGGQVGIAGHLTIGDNVIIAAKSGVTKNINDNSTIAGFPAIDIKKWKKSIINHYKAIK